MCLKQQHITMLLLWIVYKVPKDFTISGRTVKEALQTDATV